MLEAALSKVFDRVNHLVGTLPVITWWRSPRVPMSPSNNLRDIVFTSVNVVRVHVPRLSARQPRRTDNEDEHAYSDVRHERPLSANMSETATPWKFSVEYKPKDRP
jgi:hypothetical protein